MKLNTKSTGLSFALLLSVMLCQGQATNWVRQIKSSKESFAFKVLADDADFIYVTGRYEDSISLSPDNILYSELTASFLAKYDLQGNVIWAKSVTGPGRNSGASIAVDSEGFIYLLGTFEFAASMGPFHFTAGHNYDQIYLIKLNPNGVPVWARQTTGSDKTYPTGIVINSANQVYLTGTLFDRTTFMGTTVTPTTYNTPFIARLDTDGKLIWFKVLNGNGGLKDINGVTTNEAGDIFFCGTFTDNIFLDSIQLAVSVYYDTIDIYGDTLILPVYNRDYFVSQIDSTGKIVWAVQSNYLTDEYAHGVVADNNGNVYVTGGSEDSLSRSVFVARHNQYGGGLDWINLSLACGEGLSVAADDGNNMYVTGIFCGSAEINGYQVTSKGGGDIFIMNFDSSANFNWITTHGSTNNDYGWSICERDGSIFVAGGFLYEAKFGNIIVNTSPHVGWDAFVAKLDRDFLLSNEQLRPEQKMLVFPNPFGDQVTVSTSYLTTETQILSIVDISGREIFTKVIDAGNNYFTINTGHLRSGLYFLTLYGDEVSLVEKIIKQ